jgi:hypothetical protein
MDGTVPKDFTLLSSQCTRLFSTASFWEKAGDFRYQHKKMIKLPIITNYNICTPTLFRFLDTKYSELFFKDGSLRLSSFSKFKKHTDEQRFDDKEGKSFFVHRTSHNGGQSITARATHGINAYVLCATMRCDKGLMNSFNSNSYIRINNSTQFGMAIAKHIPGLISAFEGPCLYQDKKIIDKDLGYINLNRFTNPNTKEVDKNAINDFLVSKMGHYPLFLKEKSFAHQSEYRFVWITRQKETDSIDIKVPEAIKFCDEPNELTV